METLEKQNKCPGCESEDLSNGESDFLYNMIEEKEVPFQFCNICHKEWFIK